MSSLAMFGCDDEVRDHTFSSNILYFTRSSQYELRDLQTGFII